MGQKVLGIRIFVATLAGFLWAGPHTPAFAQTPIQAELDAPFIHKGSGIAVPAKLGRFDRTSVTDYREDQLNIGIQLREASKDSFATIYIYRAALPDVSVWAERAAVALSNNPSIGTLVEGTFFKGRFTPPNASGTDSGFHARANLAGKGLRSTGLSMFAHNDWIVKIRATSKTLSAEEVTRLIGEFITGLEMNESESRYPPITFYETCEKRIKFANKAKLLQMDTTGQIMLGLMIAELKMEEEAAHDEKRPWCLDPQSTVQYSVLQKGSKHSDVLIALSDSGVAAFVTRARSKSELVSYNGYLVKTSDGISEETWPLLDKRPDPRLVLQNYGRISPIGTRDQRPGAEGGSAINVTMPKKD